MNETIRQGESLEPVVTFSEHVEGTIRLTVWNDMGIVIDTSEAISGTQVQIEAGIVTAPIGKYNYAFELSTTDGKVVVIPDTSNCKGDCEFPILEVCEGVPDES